MKALVYKSTGSWYTTRTTDGVWYNARIKGVFKIDEAITSTNPIAVGDEVELEPETDNSDTAIITGIAERRNYVNRQSPSHKMQHHIIAANLDQTVLFATLRDPKTSNGFIDRFLVTAEAYHVPAILVFNKTDVYKKKEQELLERYTDIYQQAGYTVVAMSIMKNEGVDTLKELLHDKITLLSGHSGVGKSSFINTLFPERELRTKEVSGWSGKGMHTTTFAEMFDLPGGGRIIDTPGLREFGIVNIDKQELSHYFPEMRTLLQDCRFNNCLHLNEPGCAVKAAVAVDNIPEERYISYCTLLLSLGEENY